VKVLVIVAAMLAALALQTMLDRYLTGVLAVDLVLVAVVYVALITGPETGLLTGAFAGLIQDALSTTGIIGVGGLAKTLVGFIAGIIGTQFIVAHTVPRFVVFVGATIAHAVVFIGLYFVLDPRRFGTPYVAIGGQALGNAVVGIIAFQLAEFLPGALERRRASSRTRLRR
jgi:rod shape-determining protein MreD